MNQKGGIVPAPEFSQAIECVLDKAIECKKTIEKKTMLFNLTGHGRFDREAYDSHFSRNMKDLT